MSINFKNITENNVRLRIVPREGSSVSLAETNTNPTAFVDTAGNLVACFARPIFECIPQGVNGSQISDVAGTSYYDHSHENPDATWAFTALTELPGGIKETNTYRWKSSDQQYSYIPYQEAASKKVIWAGGGSGIAHFQIYAGSILPAGTIMDNPDTWAIVRYIPTPDLQPGEIDYFEYCLAPLLDEPELLIVSCGIDYFAGL